MPDFYLPPEADKTYASYRRTVGQEVEMASGADAAGVLHAAGLAPDRNLHGYACSCRYRDTYPVHPTSDCTAGGGEFIIGGSRGVLFGSKTYFDATNYLAVALQQVRGTHSRSVGMHTHVGASDLTNQQKCQLIRIYLRFQEEFLELAALSDREVRSNGNTEPRLNQSYYITSPDVWELPVAELSFPLPGRPTLNFGGRGGPTIEFRAWNASRVAWRMHLAAGVSSAMVEAAKAEKLTVPGDDYTLITFLEDIAPPDIIGLMHRQFNYHRSL